MELRAEVRGTPGDLACDEAADVANMAMIIADKIARRAVADDGDWADRSNKPPILGGPV